MKPNYFLGGIAPGKASAAAHHGIRAMIRRQELWRRFDLYLSLLRYGRAGEDIAMKELEALK